MSSTSDGVQDEEEDFNNLDCLFENSGIKKRETKKEIDDLLTYIGGFEKWNNLNDDCRIQVLKLLEYEDRGRLGFCSKRDNLLVESTPLHVDTIQVEEGTLVNNVAVQIAFNSRKLLNLVFTKQGNDTHIGWTFFLDTRSSKSKSKIVILNSSDYRKEAVKFVERWMKQCNYELENLIVGMTDYPIETSQIKRLPRCKRLRIMGDRLDISEWWIQKVPEKLLSLELSPYDDTKLIFTKEFLNQPQVMESQIVRFYGFADFTDEQFLKTKAQLITFSPVSLTSDGINKYIKKFVNGNGSPNFERAVFRFSDVVEEGKILNGLEYRTWDKEFKREIGSFWNDFLRMLGGGRCLQIPSRVDPYESLTLHVDIGYMGIYKTGHRTFGCLMSPWGSLIKYGSRKREKNSWVIYCDSRSNLTLDISQDTIYVEVRFAFPSNSYEVDFYQDEENATQRSQGGNEIRTIESSDHCQEANKDGMRWWFQWLPKDNLNVWTSTYEGNTLFALIPSTVSK
ncbi:hypothetical protein L5515_004878 [Caenorhabditis briggsae]|uniref:F-box domain-containing protein n=1 Tax=Caenorhabditis briggsae TaxID=6238 RepID=A0AAE9EIU4_CAEBR|nr:hypothetical protein L5515_004878 [Caenorhabditis briggsae]